MNALTTHNPLGISLFAEKNVDFHHFRDIFTFHLCASISGPAKYDPFLKKKDRNVGSFFPADPRLTKIDFCLIFAFFDFLESRVLSLEFRVAAVHPSGQQAPGEVQHWHGGWTR